MGTNLKQTEEQILEDYKIMLSSAVENKQIAEALHSYGYNSEVIAGGQSLYDFTFKLFHENKRKDNETLASRLQFHQYCEKLKEIYRPHRKLAKIAFANDSVAQDNLRLLTYTPDNYASWLMMMKTFYGHASSNPDIQAKMARFNITPEKLTDAYNLITYIEKARRDYLEEIGESQVATQEKDEAFAQLDNWISDFKVVARIALAKKPQMLEVLGILVRN